MVTAKQTHQDQLKAQLYEVQSRIMQLQGKMGELDPANRGKYRVELEALREERLTIQSTLEQLKMTLEELTAEEPASKDFHLEELRNELDNALSIVLKYTL